MIVIFVEMGVWGFIYCKVWVFELVIFWVLVVFESINLGWVVCMSIGVWLILIVVNGW